MNEIAKGIERRAEITQKLRYLFEMRGFKEIRVPKFEEYSLYIENRNFFSSQNIVTFTGTGGRLMALKPDITLPIIKNVPAETLKSLDRLYYVDEVCRLSKDINEYKVMDQIGVEIIGPEDALVNLDLLNVAIESLKSINEQFVLDVSHLGFVSSLLDALELSCHIREEVLSAIYSKSRHRIDQVLTTAGLEEQQKEYVLTLSSLSGKMTEVLPEASKLIISDEMKNAYEELYQIKETLKRLKLVQYVNLDFSVINDLNYYNGLIFKGYINGISDAVLSGGRYDNLMRRMGKNNCAIGFAISLSEINQYLAKDVKIIYDILLTYDTDCSYPDLLYQRKMWITEGKSVILKAFDNKDFEAKEHYHFSKFGLEKEEI